MRPKKFMKENRIAHGYLDIDPEIIWHTITEDLPTLKEQIQKLI